MASEKSRLILKTILWTALTGGMTAIACGLVVLYSGWYNVGATRQHWQVLYSVLERAMFQSVGFHAKDIVPPQLTSTTIIKRGALIYRDQCVQCHGGPGVAQADFGKSMQPVPGPLVDATKRWKPNEIYWITRHGIKMSGMPAWELHLSEEELWSVVAFLTKLPELTPQEFDNITAAATVGTK